MAARTKMFAVKVLNITRTCVLVEEFDNGIITFPILEIPIDSDPMNHLDELLSQISGKYVLVSAINILNKVDSDADKDYHSVVYEIKYDGRISTDLPAVWKYKYVKCRWMQLNILKTHNGLNYPTAAFVETMGG